MPKRKHDTELESTSAPKVQKKSATLKLDLLKALPPELEGYIARFFNKQTLATLSQLNKEVNRNIQPVLNKAKMEHLYPQPILDAFGGAENIAKFPVLDLGKERYADYLSIVTPAMMQGAKIKRGQDRINRPFISIAGINPVNGKVAVQTFHQRYKGNRGDGMGATWVGAGVSFVRDVDRVSMIDYAHLARIYRGEDKVKLTDQMDKPQMQVEPYVPLNVSVARSRQEFIDRVERESKPRKGFCTIL